LEFLKFDYNLGANALFSGELRSWAGRGGICASFKSRERGIQLPGRDYWARDKDGSTYRHAFRATIDCIHKPLAGGISTVCLASRTTMVLELGAYGRSWRDPTAHARRQRACSHGAPGGATLVCGRLCPGGLIEVAGKKNTEKVGRACLFVYGSRRAATFREWEADPGVHRAGATTFSRTLRRQTGAPQIAREDAEFQPAPVRCVGRRSRAEKWGYRNRDEGRPCFAQSTDRGRQRCRAWPSTFILRTAELRRSSGALRLAGAGTLLKDYAGDQRGMRWFGSDPP